MSVLTQMRDRTTRSLRFWQFTTLTALVAIPVSNHLTSVTDHQERLMVMMTPTNYLYVSRVGSFEDPVKMREAAALDAVSALFSRVPTEDQGHRYGFERADAIERAFHQDLTENIWSAAAASFQEIQRRRIHQKVEISNIYELQEPNEPLKDRVEAQILTVSDFEGKPESKSQKVTIDLTLSFDVNASIHGRPPYVVTSYHVEYGGPRSVKTGME